MLKYYLDRPGKIPTSVHPFSKQESLKKLQLQVRKSKFFEGLRNAFLGVGRALFLWRR